MTEQEKEGVLSAFEGLKQLAENKDDSTEFKNRAKMLLDHAGGNPTPYINAALGELDEASRLEGIKSNLLTKLSAGIDYIKSTPSEELSHELIKAHMDKA
jgi:hypothetical protein